jgi:hypothetical protein
MTNEQSLQIVWDALHDLQYHMQEGHDVFLNEDNEKTWDAICEAMSHLHETLNIDQSEID